MATINQIYTHPHVNISVDALPRTRGIPAESTATVLFAPFVAKRGSAELQKIYNLSQFIAEYGEPDFDYQGRTILNVLNWLDGGGAVYALRLVGDNSAYSEATKAFSATVANVTYASSVEIEAKTPGAYYNSVSVKLLQSTYKGTINYIDAYVYFNGKLAQKLPKLSAANIKKVLESTDYIGSFLYSVTPVVNVDNFDILFNSLANVTLADPLTNITLSGGTDSDYDFEKLLKNFYYPLSITTLGSNIGASTVTTGYRISGISTENLKVLTVGDIVRLSPATGGDSRQGAIHSIDYLNSFVDFTSTAGLTINTASNYIFTAVEKSNKVAQDIRDGVLDKKLETPIDIILDAGYPLDVKNALNAFASYRDDITFIFDNYDFYNNSDGAEVALTGFLSMNTAIYEQKVIVSDVLSGNDIWVTPTYFLARLLPLNDAVYGLQWPTAGLTRGALTSAKSINFNPTLTEKEDFYNARINYIERDSRGFRFMSQLTRHPEDDALKFLNNVRSTNRMVRELENLGRRYLFEFNDATTLLNMSNALNNYIGEWIQNRTLSFGQVVVRKSTVSDEAVDVNLRIKFTGTIEVISIDITIE